MALRASTREIVCGTTVIDTTGDEEHDDYEIVAAHKAGGHDNTPFGIPNTMRQALEHEDSGYWKAAILDEIVNHEQIFKAFGPLITREQHMKVTPTRFLFSQKLVSFLRTKTRC